MFCLLATPFGNQYWALQCPCDHSVCVCVSVCVGRLWPQYPSAHNNLATLLHSDPARAELHYRRALDLAPCHANALFNHGNLLIR